VINMRGYDGDDGDDGGDSSLRFPNFVKKKFNSPASFLFLPPTFFFSPLAVSAKPDECRRGGRLDRRRRVLAGAAKVWRRQKGRARFFSARNPGKCVCVCVSLCPPRSPLPGHSWNPRSP